MNYTSASTLGINANQDLGQINRAGMISPVRPPCLEDRLDHLHRGVERLCRVRAQLAVIADRVSMQPEDCAKDSASPPASDLNGKFGEVIGFAHRNLDDIERLVERLRSSLFNDQNQAQKAAG